MKIFLLFTTLLMHSALTINKDTAISKTITAFRLTSQFNIDGILDETAYQNKPIENLTQRDPFEGQSASEKTFIWVFYDDNAIYISAKLFDSKPDSIVGRMTRRDNNYSSDQFAVAIDSYNDNLTAFYFLVNPAGSIEDGTFFNDSWDDDTWNGVWDYAVKIDNDGWNAELKIPYSQLRFKNSDNLIWGINFYRRIQRKNEEDYFIMVPKKESGFVSHFADLIGLYGISTKQRIELLPYFVSKAQYLIHDVNDPFYKSKQYFSTIGGDAKVGIGSNLTLDLTFNPDFGQVEVDPAVVNLSAFETYYEEKRPFFIEGNNIFYFGQGGANSNWGFNWGTPEIFYSRRIGRSPQGITTHNGYENFPTETRILGAGKLSGKVGDGWSVGIINAVTEKTYAKTDSLGIIFTDEVEPLTYYGIFRAKKEINSGMQSLGFMATSTIRDLNSPILQDRLSDKSFVIGTDGWTFLDDEKNYVITGYLLGSYVHGNNNYLLKLQNSSSRYFQRPDATFFSIDSSLNSLKGLGGRVSLNKQKGNFYINSAFGFITPGFEINDVGFQSRVDKINAHIVLGYRWYEPDGIFRQKYINVSHFRNYDFDGNINGNGYFIFLNLQLMNYYGFNFNFSYNPETFSATATRGGPLVNNPSAFSFNLNGYSDSKEKVVVQCGVNYYNDKLNSNYYNFWSYINWKPTNQFDIEFGPSYSNSFENAQWISNISDVNSTYTYGKRYIFANLKQESFNFDIRINWTFTPELSLQIFTQQLISVGSYSGFKELAKPKTYEYNIYGEGNSSVLYDVQSNSYFIDPDGNGSSTPFEIYNPDFNYKSFRGNIVLRWEYKPGSVFYFVWTRTGANYDNAGDFSFKRDYKSLWKSETDNIFLLKFTYWMDI